MARHLTMEDRDRIAELKHRGARQNAIARALKRSPSTICRELKRNGSDGEYLAGQAQQHAENRRRERPILRKMDDPEIKASVCLRLKQYWSPEQIDGRLKRLASGQRVEKMARRNRTKKGRAEYARRKVIIEPVFGQIKAGLGFRNFLLRGVAKMQGEWTLVCLTHNLLKLFRSGALSAW